MSEIPSETETKLNEVSLEAETKLNKVYLEAEIEINEASLEEGLEVSSDEETSWGPKLFYGVLIAVLVFFWWMVIYPHGVTPTH